MLINFKKLTEVDQKMKVFRITSSTTYISIVIGFCEQISKTRVSRITRSTTFILYFSRILWTNYNVTSTYYKYYLSRPQSRPPLRPRLFLLPNLTFAHRKWHQCHVHRHVYVPFLEHNSSSGHFSFTKLCQTKALYKSWSFIKKKIDPPSQLLALHASVPASQKR